MSAQCGRGWAPFLDDAVAKMSGSEATGIARVQEVMDAMKEAKTAYRRCPIVGAGQRWTARGGGAKNKGRR